MWFYIKSILRKGNDMKHLGHSEHLNFFYLKDKTRMVAMTTLFVFLVIL